MFVKEGLRLFRLLSVEDSKVWRPPTNTQALDIVCIQYWTLFVSNNATRRPSS